MANYLSAVETKFTILGLDVACFADTYLKHYQRAVQLHSPLQVKLKKVIDVPILKQIVQQCNYTYMGKVPKALYLLSFYSFLRLSNLVPQSGQQFSALKHLARGNAIFHPTKVVILLKWSKTMQSNNDIKLITIPRIPHSSICPVIWLCPTFWPKPPKGQTYPSSSSKWMETGFL